MQNHFDEKGFTLRTLGSHIRQCREIQRASTDSLRNALMTTYGINRRSTLIDFPAYDLIQQTPQDIMHIMLEGVVPQEIKCALKHLILSGHIDLDSINSGIQGFPYSISDINDKPCPISVSTMASNDNKQTVFRADADIFENISIYCEWHQGQCLCSVYDLRFFLLLF